MKKQAHALRCAIFRFGGGACCVCICTVMGEDKYTHSSFTLLQTTEQIRAVVDHVLRQPDSDVPAQLRRDLAGWRDREEEEEKESKSRVSCGNVEEISSTISFDLIRRAHKQLEKTPLGTGHVYLHDLVSGSRLVLPSLLPPPRNPDLVKRLERIKRKQEQKEYDKMVSNVDNSKQLLEQARLGLEVQATSRQLWTVVNFVLTVVGAFMFAFCAAGAVGFSLPTCVFAGLFVGILVFIADLYFLVKVPTVFEGTEKLKSGTKID